VTSSLWGQSGERVGVVLRAFKAVTDAVPALGEGTTRAVNKLTGGCCPHAGHNLYSLDGQCCHRHKPQPVTSGTRPAPGPTHDLASPGLNEPVVAAEAGLNSTVPSDGF
jgi:hypothetical protein